VRGKINAFTAQDPEQGPEARRLALKLAKDYFALAGEYAREGARWAA
jgi:aminoglycoside phosphotransferase family enzyme